MFATSQASDPYRNGTVTMNDLRGDDAGISGGYNGNSLTIIVLIIFFPALSMYNALELIILVFFTFNRYKGVYFWSLLIASLGVIPYSIGFLLKFGNITVSGTRWLSVVLLTIGWWTMVTGESVVLWSRLHLILEGERGQRTLRWTKWMIVIDAIILHLPTTVLTFGSNGNLQIETFVRAYNIMEKIQMSGFFIQEVILSSIYIAATLKILKTSVREHTKKLMWQLLGVNVIIIIMDLGLLAIEAASLYLLETLLKGLIYSIKLKLEFAILGQLVSFVGRPGNSVANNERLRRASTAYFGPECSNGKSSQDTLQSSELSGFGPGIVSDFVDLTRAKGNNTYSIDFRNNSDCTDAGPVSRRPTRADSVRLPPGMTLDDVKVAMFQHAENASLNADSDLNNVPPHVTTSYEEKQKSKLGDEAV